jgi:D-serine deaminase-like pyridoxal phosphate-dependent protein
MTHEGAGEVQTPIHYDGAIQLQVGDPIIFRHAKAAEVCERFDIITAYRRTEIQEFKTYRGSGVNFS